MAGAREGAAVEEGERVSARVGGHGDEGRGQILGGEKFLLGREGAGHDQAGVWVRVRWVWVRWVRCSMGEVFDG